MRLMWLRFPSRVPPTTARAMSSLMMPMIAAVAPLGVDGVLPRLAVKPRPPRGAIEMLDDAAVGRVFVFAHQLNHVHRFEPLQVVADMAQIAVAIRPRVPWGSPRDQ